MGKYKVRVNSESESREAQELFFQLGYEKGACSVGFYPAVIVAMPFGRYRTAPYSSRATRLDNEDHRDFKELTLPELRAMVVLNRNDVNDATHEDEFFKYLELGDGWYYFKKKWIKSSGEKPEYYNRLREINTGATSTEHHENPSLNDQYAEIEKVRRTLNERESQYGSFKDVADTTSALMDQLALGRMSSVQREALHMICSKLARIANGDPNHVDSWHDIAGYATLVVDDLES